LESIQRRRRNSMNSSVSLDKPAVTAQAAPTTMPEDYGFFGPDSVTWRVWSYPTSLTVGFQRAVVVEELDPFLVAPVYATRKIITRARIRYDNTLRYFAIVAFADSRTAVKAADALVRIHARIVGVEPVSGLHYDANNPDSQLWIHLTAWHSILYAYEVYGPGKLSEEDELRYWEECAIGAELQTCSPDAVPRTREGVRQYFEQMRPRLAASEATQEVMDHLLNAEVMLPPMPRILFLSTWLINKALRLITLATLPDWQRNLANLPLSRPSALLVRCFGRVAFRGFALLASKRLQLLLLSWISPATAPVVRHVLLGTPVQKERVLTPAEAFGRYETPMPIEQYQRLKMSEEKASTIVYPPSAQVPLGKSV
jgi:uncharacterized protein (DUF2236 family)